jgi:hypothetical protein
MSSLILGPYELPPQLSGVCCLQFPCKQLLQWLDDIPLALQQTVWAQHGGIPAYSSWDVTQYLDVHCPGRWIGQNRWVVWPPQSPVLSRAIFHLWGHLKGIVHVDWCNVQNAAELAGTTVCNMYDIFKWVRNFWRSMAQLCIDCNGGHFRQHL